MTATSSPAGPAWQEPAGPRLYRRTELKGISCRSMSSIPATTSMSTSSAPSRQRGRFVSACDCGSVRSALPPRRDARSVGCIALDVAPPKFALEISGQDGAFRLDQATTDSCGFLTWGDVPRGEYVLKAQLAQGMNGYAVRSHGSGIRLQLLSDRSGYVLVLGPGIATPPPVTEEAAIDVYLLR